jgi:hypothetical protein
MDLKMLNYNSVPTVSWDIGPNPSYEYFKATTLFFLLH